MITPNEKTQLDIFQNLPNFAKYDEMPLLSALGYKHTLEFKANYLKEKYLNFESLCIK